MSEGSPLTAALLRPIRVDHCPVSSTEIGRLSQELTSLVAQRPGAGPFRLTDYVVRSALWPSASRPHPQAPFAWSAGTARRAVGLSALRALVTGSSPSPVEGVRLALHEMISGADHGRSPTSSLDQWVAGLSAAGRAAVQAEAVTWATRLWTSLDWPAFATTPVIGRAEVRSTGSDGRGNPVSVHLVVLGGPRRATVRSELSVVALVEALRTGDPLPPGRIVGWWPDSGRFVAVDVDQITLSAGVATVARTLVALEGSGAAA
jgi:hypothetical protein